MTIQNDRKGRIRCDASCPRACTYTDHNGHVHVTFCNEVKTPMSSGDLCEPICSEIIEAAYEYTWRHMGTDKEYARLLEALGGEEALEAARRGD